MAGPGAWVWAAARRRGTAHAEAGTTCQDAWRCTLARGGDVLIATVCDGAGSAVRGGAGAALAARLLTAEARLLIEAGTALPDAAALTALAARTRERLIGAAAAAGLSGRDVATTALLAIADASGVAALHVGDGAIVAGRGAGWEAIGWPEHGEYAGTTSFLTDPAPARIFRQDTPLDRLALLSDGIERLALDFAAHRPHGPFFDGMATPVAASGATGRDAALSDALGRFLDSDRVAARTDDDKTLIMAVRRCDADRS